jgi:hypothetical protein
MHWQVQMQRGMWVIQWSFGQGCLEPVTRISKLTAAQPLQIEHIGELSDFAKAKREGST